VVSVMNSCGMYNYAGQWSFEIGLAAKSGVGGGIIAVAPGQLGIAVYAPRLDRLGNSVRGIAAFRAISHDFGLHVFDSHAHGGAIMRREVGGNVVRSKRLRSRHERRMLDAEGSRIRLIELHGALYFGTAERVVRRIEALATEADWVILDFRRVNTIDHAALELLLRVSEATLPAILVTDLPKGSGFAKLAEKMQGRGSHAVYPDADAALQWCEDRLIGQAARGLDSQYALSSLSIFAGLSPAELKLLESVVKPMVYETGQVIVKEGDPAHLFYVIARGAVGVRLRGAGSEPGQGRRVAGFGPGVSFGEMALVDGGKRTADIVAEEHVVCYGFSVEDLHAIGKDHPNVLITILGNVSRETTERLGRANAEIRALEA
jgi:glutaminase